MSSTKNSTIEQIPAKFTEPRDVKKELNVFKGYSYGWKRLRGFFMNIKEFFRKVKWGFQRATKGYADIDLWNFDRHLSNLMCAALDELADSSYGYPGFEPFDTPEKWTEYLKEMSNHFYNCQTENGSDYEKRENKAYNDMCSYITRTYTVDDFNGLGVLKQDVSDQKKYDAAAEEWKKSMQAHSNFMKNEKDKALDMLKEVYYDLWD